MRKMVRTQCGCKVVCDCPDTNDWRFWGDPDAVAFYCDMVAYRNRDGRWFNEAGQEVDGRAFEDVPSAGVTLFHCVRLAPTSDEKV